MQLYDQGNIIINHDWDLQTAEDEVENELVIGFTNYQYQRKADLVGANSLGRCDVKINGLNWRAIIFLWNDEIPFLVPGQLRGKIPNCLYSFV